MLSWSQVTASQINGFPQLVKRVKFLLFKRQVFVIELEGTVLIFELTYFF